MLEKKKKLPNGGARFPDHVNLWGLVTSLWSRLCCPSSRAAVRPGHRTHAALPSGVSEYIAGLGNSENLDKGFASGFFHLYNGLHAALF